MMGDSEQVPKRCHGTASNSRLRFRPSIVLISYGIRHQRPTQAAGMGGLRGSRIVYLVFQFTTLIKRASLFIQIPRPLRPRNPEQNPARMSPSNFQSPWTNVVSSWSLTRPRNQDATLFQSRFPIYPQSPLHSTFHRLIRALVSLRSCQFRAHIPGSRTRTSND